MKKIIIYSCSALMVVLFAVQAFGQATVNTRSLQAFSAKKKIEGQQKLAEAETFARQNNIPISFVNDDGDYAELMYIKDDGTPMYYVTTNAVAAQSVSTDKVHPGGSSGLNLDGTGMTVHLWDAGAVRATHQEFTGGRVVNVDGAPTLHNHSTHVAGTLVAAGVISDAKGMASNANLKAFDWKLDESEMATAAANGAILSNHSYGYLVGWVKGTAQGDNNYWYWFGDPDISTEEDFYFGFYDNHARDWDEISYNAPYYLICQSAGNERNDGPGGSAIPPYDGPYDCIAHAAIAKNCVTVGSVKDIPAGYSDPIDVEMTSYSSWGPADDGRIKPDLVANGDGLYSSIATDDVSYASFSGTSMATPSVCGSLLLLQQHYKATHSGRLMRASTLKGLAIATADEAGTTTGPDYMFGWGLLNTEKAALKISADQTTNVIDEFLLVNGGIYTNTVYSDGSGPIKITICWTDPPGTVLPDQLDPPNPMLVNDLDLRVTNGGNTYYPWKLDQYNPAAAATNSGENNVDNIEVVYIAAPVAGNYVITVDHDGTLSGDHQYFSIIIDGAEEVPTTPLADFITDKVNFYVGETVIFSDISLNTPTLWYWTFTDGVTTWNSSEQNPSVTFVNEGTYTVTLEATNSAGTGTETKVDYITVSPPVCDASSQNYADEYISRVEVGNLDNTSLGSNYSDFTDLTFNAMASTEYTINLTPWKSRKSRKESWRVWFDYNFDGDFDDPGELVFSADKKNSAVTGTFTVPAGVSGNTVMRVAMQYNTASMSPCGTFDFGEVEDYEVYFTTPTPLPPKTDFVGNPTTVAEGNSVQFSDLSINNPTSWSWTFEGGTPSTSTSQNPVVTYNTAGSYDVSLTAFNAEGSDSKTIINYINVAAAGSYCSSASTSNNKEWIAGVEVGGSSNTSGAAKYSDFTGTIIDLTSGNSFNVTLTPGFGNKPRNEFWKIWIDFNGDGDFNDNGENVFSANRKRSTVTGTIDIPIGASGSTRMRVSMKNGGAPSSCETFGNGEVEDYTVDILETNVTTGIISGKGKFELYPNPVENILNLNFSAAEELIEVSVYNSIGSLISTFTVSENRYELNTVDFISGVYYIRARVGDDLIIKKFIKL